MSFFNNQYIDLLINLIIFPDNLDLNHLIFNNRRSDQEIVWLEKPGKPKQ